MISLGLSDNKSLPLIIIELVFIFLSVFLAFSLSEWKTEKREKELTETALYNIEQEIRSNLAKVEEGIAALDTIVTDMRDVPDSMFVGRSAYDLFVLTLAGRNPSLPDMESSSWDAALASGAAQQMDYKLLAGLSSLNNAQELGINTTAVSTAEYLRTANIFNEAHTPYEFRALTMLLQNLLGNERYYKAECDKVLMLFEE
jgi:hypothetical protein